MADQDDPFAGLSAADQGDPADGTPCSWPSCEATGNPYTDHGWCWWPRYYLWLPEGFCCPEHTAFIEEGKTNGFFRDWPRDMSPEVLDFIELAREFVPLDSGEGQRIVRESEAAANRAAFQVIKSQ